MLNSKLDAIPPTWLILLGLLQLQKKKKKKESSSV